MTKRDDGRWQEILRMPNGKYKYFYGKTKSEVLKKIAAHEEKKQKGSLFETVAADWWESHEPQIAYTTTKSYKPALKRAIAFFKDKRIDEIAPSDISRHIKKFARDHSDKTVRTQLLIYNLVFKYAVEEGKALYNPARDLSVPSNLPKRKVTSPSSADIARVKASSDCTFGLFALMALYTGMRRGELLALEWSDVDLKARVISINKSIYYNNNKPFLKPPKTTTSIGSVPIPNALLPHLKPKKGLVFPNFNGTHLTEKQFSQLWNTYCRESGVTCTPHQFRHAYATMLFENGIPPEEAQIALRHAQLSTTMDIYTDIREEKQKAVFQKILSCDII